MNGPKNDIMDNPNTTVITLKYWYNTVYNTVYNQKHNVLDHCCGCMCFSQLAMNRAGRIKVEISE
jgi:hypothetical protein